MQSLIYHSKSLKQVHIFDKILIPVSRFIWKMWCWGPFS